MNNLRIYNTLASTNKEARRLLAEEAVNDGLTILAHEQTDGKGQYGRTWLSEAGQSLTMSIIHRPKGLRVSDLPVLNMKATLGIVRALNSLDPSLSLHIKWPNDIYAGDKKLCGILIENLLSGRLIQHTIIGIGLNVNQTAFPPALPYAVSLRQLTRRTFDLIGLADLVRSEVMAILMFQSTFWKREYDELLYGKGLRYAFEARGSRFEAEVVQVTLDGTLELKKTTGEVSHFASHEIHWLIHPA